MLRNLVGLVTGGASGLGKATAKLLAEEGCKITIFDVPQSSGKDVEKYLKQIQPDATFVPGDVRSDADTTNLFSDIQMRNERLDFIVNCAGIAYAQKVFSFGSKTVLNVKNVEYLIDTNIVGLLKILTKGLKLMSNNEPDKDNLRGAIIATMGQEAFDGQLGQVPGSICSGALASSVLPLSRDLSICGIRVNGICIGVMDTPLTATLPEVMQSYINNSCLGPMRLGRVDEFAHTVKFILENKYLNAAILRLDGGLRMNLQ